MAAFSNRGIHVHAAPFYQEVIKRFPDHDRLVEDRLIYIRGRSVDPAYFSFLRTRLLRVRQSALRFQHRKYHRVSWPVAPDNYQATGTTS